MKGPPAFFKSMHNDPPKLLSHDDLISHGGIPFLRDEEVQRQVSCITRGKSERIVYHRVHGA